MKRIHLNALIDLVAFAGVLTLLSTGLILQFKLGHGSGHGMGSGRGASEREVAALWGLTRHEWGEVHYWVAYALLTVLAVHLILHWKWIFSVVRGKANASSRFRLMAGAMALAAATAMTIAPLVSTTGVVKRRDPPPGQQAASEAVDGVGSPASQPPT